ncbi:MAG: hypothetical protein ACXWQQ_15780 [Pseudobdellovibrio sp.]
MKQYFKTLVLVFCMTAWAGCNPVKYTSTEVQSPSQSLDPGVGSSSVDPTAGSSVSGTNTVNDSGNSGVSTGTHDVDNETQPLMNALEQADPEFKASGAYYVKFNALGKLVNLLIQKKYAVSPESCELSSKWNILFLSFGGNRNLQVDSCAGFQRAVKVAAAQPNGSCTPQVTASKQFNLPSFITFDRTTELGSDCLCFRRYKLSLFNGFPLSDEVRSFPDAETCASDFPEYK